MTAAEVLTETRRRGILLSARGDRLRYDAPVGVMKAELRAALVEHKAELLALLGSGLHRGPEADGSEPGPPLPPPRRSRVHTARTWPALAGLRRTRRRGPGRGLEARELLPPDQIVAGEESRPLPPPG